MKACDYDELLKLHQLQRDQKAAMEKTLRSLYFNNRPKAVDKDWLSPKIKLIDRGLEGLDPHYPKLSNDKKRRILEECRVNPRYFWEIVSKSENK